MCVCVCVCVRAFARVCVCEGVYAHVCVYVCLCGWGGGGVVRQCVCGGVCARSACVHVYERKRMCIRVYACTCVLCSILCNPIYAMHGVHYQQCLRADASFADSNFVCS